MRMPRSTLLILAMTATVAMGEDTPPLADDTARINYSVGYQVGSDFRYQEIELRPEAVIQGILDAMSNGESMLTAAEMKQVTADLGERRVGRKRQEREALKQELIAKSKAFHEANAQRPDIVTTASGLQYRIVA